MERLSALDSSFLRVETPTAHMHVGWLATLRVPAGSDHLDGVVLAERIAARLHLAPRFRQRLTSAPLGDPAWVDDPDFRLERHLRAHRGPPPDDSELQRIAGEFLSHQLPRGRPLWEIVYVPRLADGERAAVFGKVHHAMVDGIAAVELGMLLFDLAPDAALPNPVDWQPVRAAGPIELVVGNVVDGALEQFRAARRIAALGLRPRRTMRVAETMRRAALSMAEDVLNPAPPSYLNPQIGPQRGLVTARLSLERFARIKRHGELTLNDVVLGVVAGALRRFAELCEQEPRPLRVMVPVSVRGEDEQGGNRITFAFLDLPIDEPRPLRRLMVINARTRELKASGRIAGSEVLLRGVGQLPGFLKERAAQLAASPRMYNVTVSNVPGPRKPLYAAGAQVEGIYPVIPIADGHALAIGVLTYADAIHLACYVDPTALPEAPELAGLMEDAVAELERATQRRARAAPRPRSRSEAQPNQRGSSKPAYS